ncbi:FixH family protein [Defluviicoccus vanus]|uniref:FixH family protein n=1 Tax=Defluviicoccus vanus TaxID=111831 RepID=A0A7H1N6W1_9PROT|nr:FixH family protein [Defluviicoccus vanus]QNT71447.1 FixH family protein [Defluviicoccus vanus]
MIAAALISFSSAACAADADRSQDYRFEVVDQPVAVSAHSEFDVKLTKTSTGQPVENAQITQSRLEMTMTRPPQYKSATPGPTSTEMGGEVKLVGTPSPGLYRLMGDVSMPGTWKLGIVATVPGEAQPVEGTATFKAGR